MSQIPTDAWNHFMLVISLYAIWTSALAYMGGKQILWDYDAFRDEA
jgi:hypothetical protein